MKELRLLCAEDEQIRTCWMTAFRLLKVHGLRLYIPAQNAMAFLPNVIYQLELSILLLRKVSDH